METVEGFGQVHKEDLVFSDKEGSGVLSVEASKRQFGSGSTMPSRPVF